MTHRSKNVLCALGLTLGVACTADHAVPTALEVNDIHNSTLTSLGVVAEPVGADTLLIRDLAGNVIGEAWTPSPGHAELAWGPTHVTVVEDTDRTAMTCDDLTFVMVRDETGEWLPDATTPLSAVPIACHDPIGVARVVASAARPLLPEDHANTVVAADEETVGSTQEALCAGVCYTSWGLTAASACGSANADCRDGAGSDALPFCEKTSQNCGALYCSCTYCDPCQGGFATEAQQES